MPSVIFTENANHDVRRLITFLKEKNMAAAMKAADAIIKAVRILEEFSEVGRHHEGLREHQRELLIHYGKSGYVALYEIRGDDVFIISIRHAREAGFTDNEGNTQKRLL